MKCKECGSDYQTRELKCPFCDTPNMLGQIWMVERKTEEKKYQKTKQQIKEKRPYIVNKICRRIILIIIALFVLLFIGVTAYFFISDIVLDLKYKYASDGIEASMEEAYKNRDFDELDELVDNYEEEGEHEYFAYRQAIIMNWNYIDFLEYRTSFLELSEEEKQTDDFYLEYSIDYARRLIMTECGMYSELVESNKDLYDEYSVAARAYLVGALGFTEEDMELCLGGSYLLSTDTDKLCDIARERRTWQ